MSAGYCRVRSCLISTLNTSFVEKKRDINQQDFNIVDFISSNLNNFHSLEVVGRVSQAQLQVGENSNK